MNLSESILDRFLPPPLLSILSPLKPRVVEKIVPVVVEVHPDMDKKISKISLFSQEIYSTIRQIGDRPYGDMWAEMHIESSGIKYWIQADNVDSLIINSTSDNESHGLRIQLNHPTQPILHSEIRNVKTSELSSEESIISPDNYSYDGVYEVCSLLKRCKSLLSESIKVPINSSSVFSSELLKRDI